MKITRLCALIVFTLALVTGRSGARPAPRPPARSLAEAKAAFTRATADYDAERYEEARKGFERAHQLSLNPVLYFNLAACDEKLGQALVAATHLRSYLVEVPNADDAEKVRERIGALEERARQEERRRVEDARREDARTRTDAEHRSDEEALRRKAAEEARRYAPVPEAGPTPTATRRSTGRRFLGGFVGLGVTVAFGAVAAGLGGSAITKYGALDRECGGSGCPADRVDPLRTQALVSDVILGLTGAAAVATIVLFAVEARGRGRERVLSSRGLSVGF